MADMPNLPEPPLHPATRQPVRPDDPSARPTPLYRAHKLEHALRTPARIYYKHEA